jgi:hypothetical protein
MVLGREEGWVSVGGVVSGGGALLRSVGSPARRMTATNLLGGRLWLEQMVCVCGGEDGCELCAYG